MLESKAKQTGNISRNDGECQNHVLLSLRFLILSFLSVVTVSFITGRHCQLLILSALERSPVDSIDYDTSSLEYARLTVNCTDKPTDTSDLDEVPNDHESTESEVNDDIIPGRQLLVDIENVDGLFLDSNHLLRRAIINYLEERKINDVVFQPQCSSTSNGLFCYVMLRDGGRITLGTWPLRGTISITIMINDSKETLLSDLEMIEQIFGIPRKRSRFGPQVQEPYLRWATKTRGFFEKLQNVEEVDIKSYITSPLDRPWKKRVASIETKYQSIEIYDMLHPRLGSMETYTNMKNSLDSYEAKNRHLFRPDRLVYLDGVLQSRFFGEAAYHESLVHPAVLAHPNPRRVAIIGGGEGATMREVLKHKTIENVTMIDIDEEMVRFSRQYLPEWSDCSFLEGDDGSCYDDPRSEFFGLDAVAWFMDRYGGEKEVRDYEGKQYDVIIMDALDPDSKTPFSDVLYNNKEFVKALNNALTEDGMLILQTGVAADGKEYPAEFHEETSHEITLKHNLELEGFVRIYEYEDIHGGFLDVWTFMIAFKSLTSERRWFANQAQIDLELHRRAMPTKSGEFPFRFFDGATMVSLQLLSRVSADFKCKMDAHPSYCEGKHGFDPDHNHIESSSTIGSDAFGIPPGSYIGLDQAVNAIEFRRSTTRVIQQLSETDSKLQIMEKFISHFVVPMCIEDFAGMMDPFHPEIAPFVKTTSSDGLFCENAFHVWNERDLRTRRAVLLYSQESDLYVKPSRCFIASGV